MAAASYSEHGHGDQIDLAVSYWRRGHRWSQALCSRRGAEEHGDRHGEGVPLGVAGPFALAVVVDAHAVEVLVGARAGVVGGAVVVPAVEVGDRHDAGSGHGLGGGAALTTVALPYGPAAEHDDPGA